MKIVACCKIVPNEEMIKVLPNRELSFEGVPSSISEYDLNALEAGKVLARANDGEVSVVTVGSSEFLNASKIQKDILSRGADNLNLVINDSNKFVDSLQTAKAIARSVEKLDEYDLVLLGTGSSDLYTQSVGNQVGALLNIPTISNVTGIEAKEDGLLEVKRVVGNVVETYEIELPAVISVASSINNPQVPTMMDIMRAGKKPVNTIDLDLSDIQPSVEILEELAPESQDRLNEIVEGDDEEAVDALVDFLKKKVL